MHQDHQGVLNVFAFVFTCLERWTWQDEAGGAMPAGLDRSRQGGRLDIVRGCPFGQRRAGEAQSASRDPRSRRHALTGRAGGRGGESITTSTLPDAFEKNLYPQT